MKKVIEHLEQNNKLLSVIKISDTIHPAVSDAKDSYPEFEKALTIIKTFDVDGHIILDALNSYYHQATEKLNETELGDIEKKNWEGIRDKTKKLIKTLE